MTAKAYEIEDNSSQGGQDRHNDYKSWSETQNFPDYLLTDMTHEMKTLKDTKVASEMNEVWSMPDASVSSGAAGMDSSAHSC